MNAAAFPHPDSALSLLVEELPRIYEPAVTQRLVEIVKDNACVLSPSLCLSFLERYVDGRQDEEEGRDDATPVACAEPPLSPMLYTALLCVWGHLDDWLTWKSTHENPTPAAWDTFHVEKLPELCATLLRFAAAAAPAIPFREGTLIDADVLQKVLVGDVVHRALMVYSRESVEPPRASPAANAKGVATLLLSASSVRADVRDTAVWWELCLRVSPLLLPEVEWVSRAAWNRLAALSSQFAEKQAAQNTEAEKDSVLREVHRLLTRLPILQRQHNNSSSADREGRLLPLLIPIVRGALALHEGSGKESDAVRRRRVHVLHRLILEATVAQHTTTTTGWTGMVLSLVGSYYSYLPTTTPLASCVAFPETTWLQETTLLEWYGRNAAVGDCVDTARCYHRHALRLLQDGLSFLSLVDQRVSSQSLSVDSPAAAAAAPVPDGAPSQAFLLRYVQCWQSWLPRLPSEHLDKLTTTTTTTADGISTLGNEGTGGSSFYTLARGSQGEGGEAGEATAAHARFAKAHERLLTRMFARCVGDAAASHVSPLFALYSISQLNLLLAEANDPIRFLPADTHNASSSSPSCLSAHRLLSTVLSTELLKRLLRQCTSVLVRLRHEAHLHEGPPRMGTAAPRCRRRPTPRAYGGGTREGVLFVVSPPSSASWDDPVKDEEAAMSRAVENGTTRMARGHAEERRRRRWQFALLPCVIAVWARFGGGSSPFLLHERTAEGDGGEGGKEGEEVGCAFCGQRLCPQAVCSFWDDPSLLSFLASIRGDVYRLEREVCDAYPRLVAALLSEGCPDRLGAPCRVLHDGLTFDGASAFPAVLSVLGVPVFLGSASAEEPFADFFLWQPSPRTGRCTGSPPEIQLFYPPAHDLPSSHVSLEGRGHLWRAVHKGKAEYAHALLTFGALSFFSDAAVCRANAATGRRMVADTRETERREGGTHGLGRAPHGHPPPPPPLSLRVRLGTLRYFSVTGERALLSCPDTARGILPWHHHQQQGKPPSAAFPWMSVSAQEVCLQQLWKCLVTLFHRFRQVLEDDLAASAAAAAAPLRCKASAQARRGGPECYSTFLHERLLDDFGEHGEFEVSVLGPTVVAEWLHITFSHPALALSPHQALHALRTLLLLCPAATLSVASPTALLALWRRAAAAAATPTPTAAVADVGETTSSADPITAADGEELLSLALLLHFAELLAIVKMQACAAAVAWTAAASDLEPSGVGEAGGTPDVFQRKGESPFALLDDLVAERRDDLLHGVTWDGAAMPESVFSVESVAFVEVMNRASVYDVFSFLNALREAEVVRDAGHVSQLSSLPHLPEVTALMEWCTNHARLLS